ncbi:MAG: hypothetical protein ACO3A2_08095, partial [Bdellovibrionia bacterium]
MSLLKVRKTNRTAKPKRRSSLPQTPASTHPACLLRTEPTPTPRLPLLLLFSLSLLLQPSLSLAVEGVAGNTLSKTNPAVAAPGTEQPTRKG